MVQREARFTWGADNSKYRSLAAAKQQSNSIRPPIPGPSGANGEAATAWPAAGARAKRMDAYTLVKRRKCPLSSRLIARRGIARRDGSQLCARRDPRSKHKRLFDRLLSTLLAPWRRPRPTLAPRIGLVGGHACDCLRVVVVLRFSSIAAVD